MGAFPFAGTFFCGEVAGMEGATVGDLDVGKQALNLLPTPQFTVHQAQRLDDSPSTTTS